MNISSNPHSSMGEMSDFTEDDVCASDALEKDADIVHTP
jgi:hypothetical protein